MLGFLDPPKEGVGDTLKSLYQYGVDVKILTGDNELVTKKICKDIGIEVTGAIDGNYIEAIDDLELKKLLKDTTIFCKL